MSSRIHWGFKEEILSLLSRAALAYSDTEQQMQLLDEASILLWRFDESVLPRQAAELRDLLPVAIETWLPRKVSMLYKGALMQKGMPTILCDTILVDMSEDSLTLRDSLISEALERTTGKGRPASFREHEVRFGFPGLLLPNDLYPDDFRSMFYTQIPSYRRDQFIYCCKDCLYPLDIHGDHFQCSSPFCRTPKYPLAPPHFPTKWTSKPIAKYNFNFQPMLSHFAWRTIACPLVMEKRILTYLRKVVPKSTQETIIPHSNRPGFTIEENGQIIEFNPVATHSLQTISNYYSQHDLQHPVWIVVPQGTHKIHFGLRYRLPENYVVVTTQSYSYEYLNKFYLNRPRGRRIRCP
jgi:hypothetical protein